MSTREDLERTVRDEIRILTTVRDRPVKWTTAVNAAVDVILAEATAWCASEAIKIAAKPEEQP